MKFCVQKLPAAEL